MLLGPLIVFAIAALAGWASRSMGDAAVADSSLAALSLPDDCPTTEDWLEFMSTGPGIAFHYPKGWVVDHDTASTASITYALRREGRQAEDSDAAGNIRIVRATSSSKDAAMLIQRFYEGGQRHRDNYEALRYITIAGENSLYAIEKPGGRDPGKSWIDAKIPAPSNEWFLSVTAGIPTGSQRTNFAEAMTGLLCTIRFTP